MGEAQSKLCHSRVAGGWNRVLYAKGMTLFWLPLLQYLLPSLPSPRITEYLMYQSKYYPIKPIFVKLRGTQVRPGVLETKTE